VEVEIATRPHLETFLHGSFKARNGSLDDDVKGFSSREADSDRRAEFSSTIRTEKSRVRVYCRSVPRYSTRPIFVVQVWDSEKKFLSSHGAA
jgi:hypothetical protein